MVSFITHADRVHRDHVRSPRGSHRAAIRAHTTETVDRSQTRRPENCRKHPQQKAGHDYGYHRGRSLHSLLATGAGKIIVFWIQATGAG